MASVDVEITSWTLENGIRNCTSCFITSLITAQRCKLEVFGVVMNHTIKWTENVQLLLRSRRPGLEWLERGWIQRVCQRPEGASGSRSSSLSSRPLFTVGSREKTAGVYRTREHNMCAYPGRDLMVKLGFHSSQPLSLLLNLCKTCRSKKCNCDRQSQVRPRAAYESLGFYQPTRDVTFNHRVMKITHRTCTGPSRSCISPPTT
jgi:hypothetical protein